MSSPRPRQGGRRKFRSKQAGKTRKPGLPPWLGGVTVQETLQSSSASAEKSGPDAADLGVEELQPFVPPDAPEQVVTEPVDIRRASKRKKSAAAPEKVPEWLKPL